MRDAQVIHRKILHFLVHDVSPAALGGNAIMAAASCHRPDSHNTMT
jgi:hypothetical protein